MTKTPLIANGRDSGRLEPLSDAEQREVLRRWTRQTSGTPGQRGEMPEQPDDAVAAKLLDAANLAIERGQMQRGIRILQLIVAECDQSQEAACSRRVLDRLAVEPPSRGR